MEIKELKLDCGGYYCHEPEKEIKEIQIYKVAISMTKKLWKEIVAGCKKTELEMLQQVVNEIKPDENEKEYQGQAILILEQLKRVTGNSYRGFNNKGQPTANMKAIVSRLKDGFTLRQCLLVVDIKSRQPWFYKNEFHFMRPITLFKPSLFDGYVNEVKE